MNYLFLFIAFCAAVYAIYAYFTKDNSSINTTKIKKTIYNYYAKQYFITKSENDFFRMLNSVAGDRYFIFPQVHLSAILDEKIKGQNWKAAFKHINEKSVDYVLHS
jgi:hypothetical protein